jgi:sulfur carrier protein
MQLVVHVNDSPHKVARGKNLAGLLEDLAVAQRQGVAVAVNGTVVPRADWVARELQAEDRVLVIAAIQGG